MTQKVKCTKGYKCRKTGYVPSMEKEKSSGLENSFIVSFFILVIISLALYKLYRLAKGQQSGHKGFKTPRRKGIMFWVFFVMIH